MNVNDLKKWFTLLHDDSDLTDDLSPEAPPLALNIPGSNPTGPDRAPVIPGSDAELSEKYSVLI